MIDSGKRLFIFPAYQNVQMACDGWCVGESMVYQSGIRRKTMPLEGGRSFLQAIPGIRSGKVRETNRIRTPTSTGIGGKKPIWINQ